MKPASFDYFSPETLEQALSILVELEEADIDSEILAGGQSLVPMMNLRVARPEALVDLGKIGGLDYIRDEGDVIAIGAMTTKSAAEDSLLLKEQQPLFQKASSYIGHRQIRNRGTVGGSFAHADPAAEYGAVAMCLDIEIKALGPDGERVIPADEFYVTYLTSDIDSTEILTEVRVPKLKAGSGWGFREFSRRYGDLALAGAAVTLAVKSGSCENCRIAVFGVNATPVRINQAEQVINGQQPTESLFAKAGEVAAATIDEPIGDVHSSPEHRRQLVATLVKRSLADAVERAASL